MTEAYATKACPQCGARCYEDMDQCYECLYEFEAHPFAGDEEGEDLVAVGVVTVKKESAPEGALEITMRFDDRYTNFLAKSFSACC